MLYETEKERSAPRAVSAPAALMSCDAARLWAEVPVGVESDATSTAVLQKLSQEQVLMLPVLAHEHRHVLRIRRLLVNPYDLCGRKCRRASRAGKAALYVHEHAGCVFGAPVATAVAYVRGETAMMIPETLRCMAGCLDRAARALIGTRGDDAEHLKRGVALWRVLPAQARRLPELRDRASRPRLDLRLDARLASPTACIGVSALLYCGLLGVAHNQHSATALLMGCRAWFRRIQDGLDGWQQQAPMRCEDRAALDAERRAVWRAALGFERGRVAASDLGMSLSEGLQLALVCLRRAAWPPATPGSLGPEVGAATQAAHCAFIGSEAFVGGAIADLEGALDAAGGRSLSEIRGTLSDDDDGTCTCGSSSSSSSGVSSGGSVSD